MQHSYLWVDRYGTHLKNDLSLIVHYMYEYLDFILPRHNRIWYNKNKGSNKL